MSDQDDPRALWQNQSLESPMPSFDDILKRVDTFRLKVTRRNWREYAAAVIVVIAFTFFGFHAPNLLFRIGCGLLVAATGFVVYFIRTRGEPTELPANATVSDYIAFHRRELMRQRDLLKNIVWWYIAPFVPGLGFFLAGIAQMGSANRGAPVPVRIAVVAVVFLAIWALNHRGAKRLQKQIDALGHDPGAGAQ